MSEIERITRQLEKAFEKQPWYGTSIKGILKDVNPSVVHKKMGPHSIIILLMHMVTWRRYATSKLLGGDLKVTAEMNFPDPPATAEAWTQALKELDESQKELMAAVSEFPDNRLEELVPAASHKYTWYTLLHGIIQHDVYHIGQIALLKKALQ